MKLGEIVNNTNVTKIDKFLIEKEIKDIKIDSRIVEKGDLFIALNGENFDGNQFVKQAIERGASIVISEKKLPIKNSIIVKDARRFYSLSCKNFFKKCCDKMKIIAVTGTNGKTTITSIIYQILQNSGKKTGIIGTFGAKINKNDDFIETGFTTPDPYLLHKIFKKMYEAGCEYVVMEASAHAIFLRKLEGINFEVSLLSNITEDHLDFFKNMLNYSMAKAELFLSPQTRYSVFYGDDKVCKEISKFSFSKSVCYGVGDDNDVRAVNIQKTLFGTKFECELFNEKFKVDTEFVGEYNIANILGAVCILKKLGLDNLEIEKGLRSVKQPKGRFNVINNGEQNIIIDYAHTPDGLEKILSTARDLSKKQLVVVFGCGGNRDRKKRPIMGSIASHLADEVILTSDNPRNENPIDIINEIKQGITSKCLTIENREKAIRFAIKKYPFSTIVIAGKGAENYQEIRNVKYHFSDFEIVEKYTKKNRKRQNYQQNALF